MKFYNLLKNPDGKLTKKLNSDIANELIDAWKWEYVAIYLSSFKNLDNTIAIKLIDAWAWEYLITYFNKFKWVDNTAIAIKLIDAWEAYYLIINFNKFKWVDNTAIAIKLIDAWEWKYVVTYLEIFDWLKKYYWENLYNDRIEEIKKSYNKNIWISKEALVSYEDSELNKVFDLYEYAAIDGVESHEGEDVYLQYYQKIKEKELAPFDDDEIANRFEKWAEVFGYKRMFEYSKNNRHDALYSFDEIVSLFEISGLKEKQFYNNILKQIKMRDVNLWSFLKLNNIARSFKDSRNANEDSEDINYSDIVWIIEEAKKYPNLEKMSAFLEKIKEPKDIFSGFLQLVQYYDICELLQNKDLLHILNEEKDEKLKTYISTLAYHPSIENMSAVAEFYNDPKSFFWFDSSHTDKDIHDRKKPSNYVDIPNLDLSAKELRDALVGWSMDTLQEFEPMKIEYELPQSIDLYQKLVWWDIVSVIKTALWEYNKETKEASKWAVKNSKILFSRILGLLDEWVMIPDILTNPSIINEETTQKIRNLIYNDKMWYGKRMEKYIAKIALKSDPEAVVAGNETDCCMPFWDGKNTLYNFNPVTSMFLLQKEINYKWKTRFKTIAQSVVTRDKNIGKNVGDVISGLNSESSFSDVLDERVLENSKEVIALDSVEVSSNFQKKPYDQIISDVYRDFFKNYIAEYESWRNVDRSKVVQWSYSYELKDSKEEPNTYVPLSPVSYSDKLKRNVGGFDLKDQKIPSYVETTSIQKNRKPEHKELDIKVDGIEYLTFKDTLEISYIEGKAYTWEAKTLIEWMSNLENSLIAKDINNVAKSRSNMSFKYLNQENKVTGYLLAYEGKDGVSSDSYDDYDYDDYDYDNEYADVNEENESVLYIQDFAKLTTEKKAWIALIKQFLNAYKVNYLDKWNAIPIKAEARDDTSFRVLKMMLSKYAKELWVDLELDEKSQYKKGDILMHSLFIRVKE